MSPNVIETDSYPVEAWTIVNTNAVTSHSDVGINRNMEIDAVNVEMNTESPNSIVNNKNTVYTDPEISVKSNLNTESDNDTILYNDSSDTGMTLMAEDSEHEINLNSTTDYTNQEVNLSDTEVEELILNKCISRTYSCVKKASISRVTKDLPALVTPTLCTNIDMSEDNINTDANAELLNLSDTFADSLVIRDLEQLMDESEPTQQTILPIRPQSPRGSFTYRFQGIRRKSRTPVSAGENKYKCPTCPKTWNTRGEMCEHYRNSHPPLPCMDCNMTFTSPLSLARHSYKHRERPYECEVCGEKFAFNSKLTQHSPVHKERGGLFCMANNCSKEFIRQGDLNAHILTHTAPLLRCEIDAECTYTTRNPRLYRAHTNTHTRRKKYPCKHCGEEFNYTQQVKRHVEKYHA